MQQGIQKKKKKMKSESDIRININTLTPRKQQHRALKTRNPFVEIKLNVAQFAIVRHLIGETYTRERVYGLPAVSVLQTINIRSTGNK